MYNERQRRIIRYLTEMKFAKVEQLAEIFGVSIETVRRDLLELEKNTPIKRIRGGAVFNNMRAQEVEYQRRMEDHRTEKQAIARVACEYVNNGDALALNNGTATLALAGHLVKQREQLTIITNSPEIASILNENKSNHVYLTSGYLRKHNKSLVGSMCQECLGNFRVDKTIVSIDGVSIRDGITEYNSEEAAVIKQMFQIAQTKMIVCEFGKFNEIALNRICPSEMIDYIFTDWNISAREVKEWLEINVKVISAERKDDYIEN